MKTAEIIWVDNEVDSGMGNASEIGSANGVDSSSVWECVSDRDARYSIDSVLVSCDVGVDGSIGEVADELAVALKVADVFELA